MKTNKAAKKKSPVPLIMILGVLAVAVVGGAMLVNSNRSASVPPQNSPQEQVDWMARAAPGALPPRAKGPENAPVVIEEFGDYQCPSCRVTFQTLNNIEADYGNRVRVVFRHLPLQSIHRNASIAARAAESAGLQGRFWQMHDAIYENQNEWKDMPDPRPTFAVYAQRVGADVEKFKADIDKGEVGMRVSADVQRANSLRITGTPTLILNNRPLTTEQTMQEDKLRSAIEAALAGGTR